MKKIFAILSFVIVCCLTFVGSGCMPEHDPWENFYKLTYEFVSANETDASEGMFTDYNMEIIEDSFALDSRDSQYEFTLNFDDVETDYRDYYDFSSIKVYFNNTELDSIYVSYYNSYYEEDVASGNSIGNSIVVIAPGVNKDSHLRVEMPRRLTRLNIEVEKSQEDEYLYNSQNPSEVSNYGVAETILDNNPANNTGEVPIIRHSAGFYVFALLDAVDIELRLVTEQPSNIVFSAPLNPTKNPISYNGQNVPYISEGNNIGGFENIVYSKYSLKVRVVLNNITDYLEEGTPTLKIILPIRVLSA